MKILRYIHNIAYVSFIKSGTLVPEPCLPVSSTVKLSGVQRWSVPRTVALSGVPCWSVSRYIAVQRSTVDVYNRVQ